MGVHGMSSNNKKVDVARRKQKRAKIMRRASGRKKGALKHMPKTAEILDSELMTTAILKKRHTSSRTNITLSGKKKRKLIKQLKYQEKEKSQMEAEETPTVPDTGNVEMAEPSDSKKISSKKSKKKNKKLKDFKNSDELSDVDME